MRYKEKPSVNIRSGTPLAQFSTLGVGGPARYFHISKSVDDLGATLDVARKRNLPVFILAGGSNIVVSDDGFKGLVIKIEIEGMTFDGATATVGAGVVWDAFVAECVARGLGGPKGAPFGGVQNLSAIPGTVGASPVQNIGAYGVEVKDVIHEVHAIHRATRKPVVLSNEECRFGYRASIFNTTHKNIYVITHVVFSLTQADAQELTKERNEIIATRTTKGHIAPPVGPRSAGSFFKNPIVNGEKLFAAKLIEEVGFVKGERSKEGHVGISPYHALVLVTYEGATARELLDFAEHIRQKVKNRFDILLDIEPELVGF